MVRTGIAFDKGRLPIDVYMLQIYIYIYIYISDIYDEWTGPRGRDKVAGEGHAGGGGLRSHPAKGRKKQCLG